MFPAYRVDDCNTSLWMCLEVLKMSSLQCYALFLMCLKCGKNIWEPQALDFRASTWILVMPDEGEEPLVMIKVSVVFKTYTSQIHG